MDAETGDLRSWTSDFLHSLREAEVRMSQLQPDVLTLIDAALYRTLLKVRNEYNQRCLINRLPPEILIKIFLLILSPVDIPSNVWPISVATTSAVLPVTLVCRYWYNVSMNCAFLWNNLTDHVSSQLCLQRSRGAPLNLVVGLGVNPVHYSILKSGPSIRELHLLCDSSDQPNLEPIAAPELRVLTLFGWKPKDEQLSLFQRCTPQLQQLSITQSLIPRGLYSSLLRLCIRKTVPISVHDLLSCLTCSPNLEDLILWQIKIDTTYLSHGSNKVHMSRLRTLAVGELFVEDYDIILSRISVNTSAAILVESRTVRLVVPYSHVAPDFAKLSVWSRSQNIARVKMAGPTSAIYTTSQYVTRTFWDHDILANVNLNRIRELWVEYDFGQASLLPLLKQMTALDTLALYIDTGAIALELFTAADMYDSPLCPTLSTLHLLINEDGINHGALIHEFVVTRARHGYPLSNVIMEATLPVDEEGILASLEGYVGEICFRLVKTLSSMSLPAICTEKRHTYWNNWTSS